MKTSELFREICGWGSAFSGDRTCDTFKSGDPEAEIARVGVCMFPTVDVIRACAEKGINFLIVHEPLYYNHWDTEIPGALAQKKKELVEQTGLTIARFHDHAHAMEPDLIYQGELECLRLPGKMVKGPFFGINFYDLDEPMTARELARAIEQNLGLHHVRIAGCADRPGRRVGTCFGACGHHDEMMELSDFVIAGEINEWKMSEIARDYAAMGENKALLVLTHEGSERAGMMLLADLIRKAHPELDVEYLESGEVFTYTD